MLIIIIVVLIVRTDLDPYTVSRWLTVVTYRSEHFAAGPKKARFVSGQKFVPTHIPWARSGQVFGPGSGQARVGLGLPILF